jgi:hypothetical protein
VELSDSNHDGQDDPTGDDDGGQGAPSTEPTVLDLIRSGMAAQVLPSVADQLTTAAFLGSGHPKKRRIVLVSKHKQHASSDQVTIELFPHHAPQRSLSLVVTRLVFGAYLKFSNASLRLPELILQLGLTLSQPKGFRCCQ